MIITPYSDNVEERFGKKIQNHVIDNKPSPGYVDDNGYFHPQGNDDRKKWSSFKKSEPRVQHYLNLGVTETYIKAHITRLAKLGFDTETCWSRFEQLYEQDRLQFAAIRGKEEALIKFSLENPEVKDEAGNLIEPDKKPNISPTLFDKVKSIFIPVVHSEKEEEIKTIERTSNKSSEALLEDLINFNKIKLSGGIVFEETDIKSCINGKLQLHSQKKAIKLTKKQIKELDAQI